MEKAYPTALSSQHSWRFNYALSCNLHGVRKDQNTFWPKKKCFTTGE